VFFAATDNVIIQQALYFADAIKRFPPYQGIIDRMRGTHTLQRPAADF
jgi:hypothetical protein